MQGYVKKVANVLGLYPVFEKPEGEAKVSLAPSDIDNYAFGTLGLIYSMCAGDISKLPTVGALSFDMFFAWLLMDVQYRRKNV